MIQNNNIQYLYFFNLSYPFTNEKKNFSEQNISHRDKSILYIGFILAEHIHVLNFFKYSFNISSDGIPSINFNGIFP